MTDLEANRNRALKALIEAGQAFSRTEARSPQVTSQSNGVRYATAFAKLRKAAGLPKAS